MKNRISLLVISKNCETLLYQCLASAKDLVDEIVVVDNYSKDKTVKIAKKFGARVCFFKGENLGKQRALGLKKCKEEWVLVLDSDEIVSKKLRKEIAILLNGYIAKYDGYLIPFKNHLFGKPLKYGGENYKKLILFRKSKASIKPLLVHEKFEVKGKVGELKNKILHYSYRSIFQIFSKFTEYAIKEARQKALNGEKSSLKKIFLYPIHMFWARFIKDKGYKDGIVRIILDLGFGYMEMITYTYLFYLNVKSTIKKLKVKSQKYKSKFKII